MSPEEARKRWIPWALLAFLLLLILSGKGLWWAHSGEDQGRSHSSLPPPQRIVSLAPSVTEVLFALGLGERVVGVTRHCRYPPQVRSKEKVGDYYRPDYEAILTSRPDLVVLLPEHEEVWRFLSSLGVRTLMVNHFTIQGILDSLEELGRICGTPRGEQIAKEIRERMEAIRRRTAGLDRPRVLVSLGRNMGAGAIKEVYICGEDGFYSELIRLAGGRNAYPGKGLKFPTLSAEGIVRLDPQIILDLVPDLEESKWRKEDILRQWSQLGEVEAVAHQRVHILSGSYTVVPGPRFILILEEMARLIHPEVDWD